MMFTRQNSRHFATLSPEERAQKVDTGYLSLLAWKKALFFHVFKWEKASVVKRARARDPRDRVRSSVSCALARFALAFSSLKNREKIMPVLQATSPPRSRLCFWMVEVNFTRATTNQKHWRDLGRFMRSFLRRRCTGQPMVASRNVVCFLSIICCFLRSKLFCLNLK